MIKRRQSKRLIYKDIKIGSTCRFNRYITNQDVDDFACLSGDYNPLHMDDNFAKGTQFGGRIIHGMLAASLFSTLIGMYCPGKHALILSQDIRYMKPIRPSSMLTVKGEVTHKVDSIKVIVLKAVICGSKKEILVESTSKVKVMK